MKRPVGVTIIAVLAGIGGVLTILSAIGVVMLLNAINEMGAQAGVAPISLPFLPLQVWIAIWIVLGVLLFAGAFGAWKLKKWAWPLLVGLSVFGIVQSLSLINVSGTGVVFTLVINGVILYYLFKVKEAFNQ